MTVLHGKEIIHRDLNTANVLVTFMKEEGRLVAKICDFGLARRLRKGQQDRVHSSFMISPMVKNSLPNTLPLPIPSALPITAAQSAPTVPHSSSRDRSLPSVLASGSATSMAGADVPSAFRAPPASEIGDIPELSDLNDVPLDAMDDISSLGGTMAHIEPGDSLDALTTECGTVAYMAPELLEHLRVTKHFTFAHSSEKVLYTKSVDAYAFGLILWELCTELPLYQDLDDLRDIRQRVLSGKRPHIPSYILGSYAGLIKDAWSQSPLHRPDFAEMQRRLRIMAGLSRGQSEDNSLYSWTLVDAMRDSGRY